MLRDIERRLVDFEGDAFSASKLPLLATRVGRGVTCSAWAIAFGGEDGLLVLEVESIM